MYTLLQFWLMSKQWVIFMDLPLFVGFWLNLVAPQCRPPIPEYSSTAEISVMVSEIVRVDNSGKKMKKVKKSEKSGKKYENHENGSF